jgi:tight adherence protein C
MAILIIPVFVAAGILLLVIGLAGGSSVDPVQARLTQLGSAQAKNLEELDLQQPFAERTLRPLVARLSRMGSRLSNASSADVAERRLAMAGNPGDLKLTDWVGVKILVGFVVGVILFFVLGVLLFSGAWTSPVILVERLMFGLVGFGIGYLVPEFWLGSKIKARQKVILKMVPDALDLLTISVRAGLGFDAALAKVVEKLPGPLTDEFRRALAEIRVGKSRREALRDLVPRTNVAPLSSFIGAIIQAETLGVSISKVLQVQSEQLRIERRQRAEEMAARAPIKMLFPLVGCIFPSLFIVILGPAFIVIIKTMSSGAVP